MIAVKDYWSLTKPKQTFLLVYCGVCAMLAGNPSPPLSTASLVILAFFLSIAETTAVANYVDRSVDAVMERTKGRPSAFSEGCPVEGVMLRRAAGRCFPDYGV